jgi:hypothetical protein
MVVVQGQPVQPVRSGGGDSFLGGGDRFLGGGGSFLGGGDRFLSGGGESFLGSGDSFAGGGGGLTAGACGGGLRACALTAQDTALQKRYDPMLLLEMPPAGFSQAELVDCQLSEKVWACVVKEDAQLPGALPETRLHI